MGWARGEGRPFQKTRAEEEEQKGDAQGEGLEKLWLSWIGLQRFNLKDYSSSSQPPAAAARRQRMSSTVMAHHGRKLPFRYGRSSAEVTSGRISLTGTEVGEHIAAV